LAVEARKEYDLFIQDVSMRKRDSFLGSYFWLEGPRKQHEALNSDGTTERMEVINRDYEKLETFKTRWLNAEAAAKAAVSVGMLQNVDMAKCASLVSERNLDIRQAEAMEAAKRARYEGLERDAKLKFEIVEFNIGAGLESLSLGLSVEHRNNRFVLRDIALIDKELAYANKSIVKRNKMQTAMAAYAGVVQAALRLSVADETIAKLKETDSEISAEIVSFRKARPDVKVPVQLEEDLMRTRTALGLAEDLRAGYKDNFDNARSALSSFAELPVTDELILKYFDMKDGRPVLKAGYTPDIVRKELEKELRSPEVMSVLQDGWNAEILKAELEVDKAKKILELAKKGKNKRIDFSVTGSKSDISASAVGEAFSGEALRTSKLGVADAEGLIKVMERRLADTYAFHINNKSMADAQLKLAGSEYEAGARRLDRADRATREISDLIASRREGLRYRDKLGALLDTAVFKDDLCVHGGNYITATIVNIPFEASDISFEGRPQENLSSAALREKLYNLHDEEAVIGVGVAANRFNIEKNMRFIRPLTLALGAGVTVPTEPVKAPDVTTTTSHTEKSVTINTIREINKGDKLKPGEVRIIKPGGHIYAVTYKTLVTTTYTSTTTPGEEYYEPVTYSLTLSGTYQVNFFDRAPQIAGKELEGASANLRGTDLKRQDEISRFWNMQVLPAIQWVKWTQTEEKRWEEIYKHQKELFDKGIKQQYLKREELTGPYGAEDMLETMKRYKASAMTNLQVRMDQLANLFRQTGKITIVDDGSTVATTGKPEDIAREKSAYEAYRNELAKAEKNSKGRTYFWGERHYMHLAEEADPSGVIKRRSVDLKKSDHDRLEALKTEWIKARTTVRLPDFARFLLIATKEDPRLLKLDAARAVKIFEAEELGVGAKWPLSWLPKREGWPKMFVSGAYDFINGNHDLSVEFRHRLIGNTDEYKKGEKALEKAAIDRQMGIVMSAVESDAYRMHKRVMDSGKALEASKGIYSDSGRRFAADDTKYWNNDITWRDYMNSYLTYFDAAKEYFPQFGEYGGNVDSLVLYARSMGYTEGMEAPKGEQEKPLGNVVIQQPVTAARADYKKLFAETDRERAELSAGLEGSRSKMAAAESEGRAKGGIYRG
jgi:hypothetical protein